MRNALGLDFYPSRADLLDTNDWYSGISIPPADLYRNMGVAAGVFIRTNPMKVTDVEVRPQIMQRVQTAADRMGAFCDLVYQRFNINLRLLGESTAFSAYEFTVAKNLLFRGGIIPRIFSTFLFQGEVSVEPGRLEKGQTAGRTVLSGNALISRFTADQLKLRFGINYDLPVSAKLFENFFANGSNRYYGSKWLTNADTAWQRRARTLLNFVQDNAGQLYYVHNGFVGTSIEWACRNPWSYRAYGIALSAMQLLGGISRIPRIYIGTNTSATFESMRVVNATTLPLSLPDVGELRYAVTVISNHRKADSVEPPSALLIDKMDVGKIGLGGESSTGMEYYQGWNGVI
jgi:hypothetical protein